jgi:hypothetical protein
MNQGTLSKKAFLTSLFLWLHASQVYARVGTTFSTSRSLATDPSCYPDAKSVKIETADKQLLNIIEVRAFSLDDVNVALDGAASQSSDYNSGSPASNAIDGNDTTVAHTANGDPNPWWQVDFAISSSLKSVEIKNRHCATAPACLCRLSGATVSVTNELGEVIDTKILGNTCEVSDISLDLSTCSESPVTPTVSPTVTIPQVTPPSTNAGSTPLITFDDAIITSDDSFEITFNNPLDQTKIYAAVVSNSHCTDDNSYVEVNSDTENAFVGCSSVTVLHSINELITAEQRNTGSVLLEFCLRADVHAAGFPSSLLASKMSLGITVNFQDESGIILNDSSSGFTIEVVTADLSETIVDYTDKRGVSISAFLGECASPGDEGPYAIGSTLKFCVKSIDSDVIVSSLNDVSFTDLEGNAILGITDASGEPSFVTVIDGIDSKEVDVATKMATTIFDQGYGGTTINVQGSVSVTYVDQAIGNRRQLKTEESQPFAFKIAVGETAVEETETYYSNSTALSGNVVVGVIIAGVAVVGLVLVSVFV